MKTFTTQDKTDWGPGPWQNEPDKAVWVDGTTNLDCMIHRGPTGALCGYVGVPAGHPLYGGSYDELDVDVHGGLTYGATCQEEATEDHGICHVPELGRPHDVFWYGFDCAHAFDLSPRFGSLTGDMPPEAYRTPDEVYRTFAYVKAEVERLADQLAHL